MTASLFDLQPDEPALDDSPRLRVERLSKRYGTNWVLKGLTFELDPGEALLIAGPNGAGKSTLLRVIATSLPYETGSVHIGPHPIPTEADRARNRIAYSGHRSLTYETLSALENLEVWRDHLGIKLEQGTMGELLYRVGLSRAASTTVDKFSAGMKRRLTLARILLQMIEPGRNLVILDEPYEQLDREGFEMVGNLIDECRADGAAIVLATHLIERAVGRASRAIYLDRGEIRFHGSPAELIRFTGALTD